MSGSVVRKFPNFAMSTPEMAHVMGISVPTARSYPKKGCPIKSGGDGRPYTFWMPDVMEWWKKQQAESLERLYDQRTVDQIALRDKIDGELALRTIFDIDQSLKDMETELERMDTRFIATNMRADGVEKMLLVDALNNNSVRTVVTRIGILKQRLDVQFRLLDKQIPDLKAIELSDSSGSNPLAAAAVAFAAALRVGME